MTSTKFIKEVAETAGVTQKNAREMANAFETVLKNTLARGESVKFADVNYSVKDVEARVARNPATGETFECPATKKVVVKPSSTMKKVVKE